MFLLFFKPLSISWTEMAPVLQAPLSAPSYQREPNENCILKEVDSSFNVKYIVDGNPVPSITVHFGSREVEFLKNGHKQVTVAFKKFSTQSCGTYRVQISNQIGKCDDEFEVDLESFELNSTMSNLSIELGSSFDKFEDGDKKNSSTAKTLSTESPSKSEEPDVPEIIDISSIELSSQNRKIPNYETEAELKETVLFNRPEQFEHFW